MISDNDLTSKANQNKKPKKILTRLQTYIDALKDF